MGERRTTERETWAALRSLVLEHYDRRREVSETLGMSFVRSKALTKLSRRPMTMRELGGVLAIDAPYTTVVVDDLEARGYVTRSPHPDDRRVKLVTITAEGKAVAKRADKILLEPPAVVGELATDDLAALHRIVGELIARSESSR